MEHILSLSYGKDSLACLGALDQLGWPLDRIIHAEVWATDDITADLPPMVEFKAKADKIIKERWGIEVEHFSATKNGEKLTYEKLFYHVPNRKNGEVEITGFPFQIGPWCNTKLKVRALPKTSVVQKTNIVQYLGIAADELKRIERHKKPGLLMPLVEIGWNEDYCHKWCEENDLISPIYTSTTRGGCWFCNNQNTEQLRLLKKNYPDLWTMLLKWDMDSPISFKADGHTVRDYDERFQLEDEGLINAGERFRWEMLEDGGVNYRLF